MESELIDFGVQKSVARTVNSMLEYHGRTNYVSGFNNGKHNSIVEIDPTLWNVVFGFSTAYKFVPLNEKEAISVDVEIEFDGVLVRVIQSGIYVCGKLSLKVEENRSKTYEYADLIKMYYNGFVGRDGVLLMSNSKYDAIAGVILHACDAADYQIVGDM